LQSFAKKIHLEEVMDADAAWSRIFLLSDFERVFIDKINAGLK